MGAVIPAAIFGLEGQVIKDIVINEASGRVRIVRDRNRRRRPVDHRTGRRGRVNRLLRRTVLDVPLFGSPCEVEIEYAETFVSPGQVRVEALPFVAPGARVTRRLARLIAGMARHMPIAVVARHAGLSWDAVKAIECGHLMETLDPPRPQILAGIRYLGVDEVARAKGQSYFTLAYDLTPRRPVWHGAGRKDLGLERVREDPAIPPHRHLQLRRASDHHGATGGRQRQHRLAQEAGPRLAGYRVLQAQDIPVEHLGLTFIPLYGFASVMTEGRDVYRRNYRKSQKTKGYINCSAYLIRQIQ